MATTAETTILIPFSALIFLVDSGLDVDGHQERPAFNGCLPVPAVAATAIVTVTTVITVAVVGVTAIVSWPHTNHDRRTINRINRRGSVNHWSRSGINDRGGSCVNWWGHIHRSR